MPEAFLLGVAAGYAIAIPLGPIAVLILRTGVSRGFAAAAAAGAGTATADLVYATIAMLFGTAASALIQPVLPVTRVVAAVLLAAIALRSVLVRPAATIDAPARAGGNTFLVFLGLTLVNPPTVIYFVSLVLALPEVSADGGSRVAFVTGAFLASLSWQELLAAGGALFHGRLTPRMQRVTAVASAALILALAARVLTG